MKKIKKLVVGNWKMNPATIAEAKKICSDVKKISRSIKNTQVVFCPPFVYLSSLSAVPTTTMFLGAQNAYYEPMGSYTGEVSFSQLHQFKVSHVIIGHSERRKMGETDEMVNKKTRAVVGDGMTAIVCVGESVRDEAGDYLAVIKAQVTEALQDVSKKLIDHVVIAYEPVWAIGAKSAMTPGDVHETGLYIRKVLKDLFGPLADSVRVLYGGSVTADNAGAIVEAGHVDGLLVGRDSLVPKNFVQIIKSVDLIK